MRWIGSDLRRGFLMLAVLTAGLGLLAACGSKPAAERTVPKVAARLAKVEKRSAMMPAELAGSVEAARASTVSSRVMAAVVGVDVTLGAHVEAGQTLLRLDPAAAEGAAAQARGAVAQAEAGLALAERNFERYRVLAEKNAAAPVELDLARTQLEQARGAVEQARGALAAARSMAGDARVVAPFSGRVAGRFVEVGDLAAPGRPLVAIESEHGRRFVASVPEQLFRGAGLTSGMRLPVRLDARNDLGTIRGTVVETSPGPDAASHSYTLKIDLGDVAASAGAAGRVTLSMPGREAVWVPREAILEQGGLSLVVVRDESGAARTVAVALGATTTDGRIELLSGLAGNEIVLVGLTSAPPAGALVEESR